MTCAKRRVVAVISKKGRVLGVGENDCSNPQEKCPRGPGEDYEKCSSICQQGAHAEIRAILDALETYSPEELRGAWCKVIGHDRICNSCYETLSRHGIYASASYGGGFIYAPYHDPIPGSEPS